MVRRTAAGAVLVLTAACARPAPPPPIPRDTIALAPDPESGEVGALVVRTDAGEVTLDAANAATTAIAGQAPSAPVVLPPEEIQRLFGEAMAALPPAARRFVLYFDTGEATLTAESRALVSEILTALQGRPAPEVSVVGHTDTTGTAASNVTLGQRRAEMVRDVLVGDGIDAALIEVTSHGEANLLVPTPDGTAEARNRRVEVTVR